MENKKLNMKNNYKSPGCYEESDIDLRELFIIIAKHKKFIFLFVFVVTILTIIYVLAKPNEYKIYTVLAPKKQSKNINLEGLTSLASMAGVNIGGNGGVTPDIAFQQLVDNYTFMKEFIIKRRLDKKLLNGDLEKDYVFVLNYK